MKIVHRISLTLGPVEQAAFANAGLPLEQGLQMIEIDESDPRWSRVSQLQKQFVALDMVSTKFSNEELRAADCLRMGAAGHHGYPQPENAWLSATYSLAKYCPECGMGAVQKNPFRMRSEPKWVRNAVMQLNWVFEEFFVQPAVWHEIFEPFGIACRPVDDRKGTKVLETVVQLDLTSSAEIDTSQLVGVPCPHCGRIRYLPHKRGYYPAPLSMPKAMFRSTQYFGSGASANRSVFVSKALYERIEASAIRGALFTPCADLPPASAGRTVGKHSTSS